MSLRHLVPTLERMVADRRGFTLIELMTALALSVLIVLIAASAYRLVAQAITQVNAWSTENQLLRTGFVQALDDVDYWHSHANGDAPFEKDFARARGTVANPERKRPFQPIRFSAATSSNDGSNAPGLASHGGLILNPNVFLPHDPRAWYRHRTFPNTRPAGPRDDGTSAFVDWSDAPDGWKPSHVFGDYGLTSATDMSSSHADPLPRFDALPGIDPRQHQARPRMMWGLFQHLSYIGVAEYMPADCPWLMMGPDGRMPHPATIPNSPICLALPADSNLRAVHNYGSKPDRDRWSLNGSADWLTMLGGSFIRSRDPTYQAFTMQPFPGRLSGEFDGDQRDGDGWTNGAMVSGGSEHRFSLFTYHGREATGSSRSYDFLSATVRIPYNLSDATRPSWFDAGTWKPFQKTLDYASRPAGMPMMSTSILRFHEFAGSNLVINWVKVEIPETGKLIELGFTTIGTTWRGARQHWRLDPRWPTAASPDAIGDYYE